MRRVIVLLIVALLLGGCAHEGAIPKSPCACVFHPLEQG
jgi:PBP1b-binding outer membrane lipoprotein LpoB